MSSVEQNASRKRASDDQEAVILKALSAGDTRQATTLAMRAYGAEILRYLGTLLAVEVDTKEAFSLFGERLWQGLAAFRGESSIRTWMFRVAWSAASDLRKDTFRSRGRRLETEEGAGLAGTAGVHGTRTWLRLERQAVALEKMRDQLSLEDQCLLQLRIDRGLSWEACSQILSRDGAPVPAPTLRKRFERLKERLRALLDEGA